MSDPNPTVDGPGAPIRGHERLCDEFAAAAPLLVEGDLVGPVADRLRSHAAGCAPCATVLRRQTTLSAWLGRLPAPPTVSLSPPPLPSGRVLPLDAARRRRRRVAAAAAGIAAAAVAAVATLLPSDAPQALVPVRVVHVRDVAESAPLPDDDLLALTAGVESVAMRRPTGWPSTVPASPAGPR